MVSEYNDLTARIARIEAAANKLLAGRAVFSLGTATMNDNGLAQGSAGFFARIGDLIEYRPTLGGAVVAIEQLLADLADDRVRELAEMTSVRDALRGQS